MAFKQLSLPLDIQQTKKPKRKAMTPEERKAGRIAARAKWKDKNPNWRRDPNKKRRDDKTYREKNKARLREYGKRWRKVNRETLLTSKKAYRLANPEATKEAQKAWRNANREKIAKKAAADYRADPEKQRRRNRKHYSKPENREKSIRRLAAWYKANKKEALRKANIYIKSRRRTDVQFRLRTNLSARLRLAVHEAGTGKHANTMALVGCSIEELRLYLESKFLPGMTWDNYGLFGWHIDHIRPCVSFDLTKPEEQRRAFAYTNLQPLWATDNLKKGDSLPEAFA